MKLQPELSIPLEIAIERASKFLRERRGRLVKANEIANAIWPGHKMTSQGAGAAASRVLKVMSQPPHNLVKWNSQKLGAKGNDWGWTYIGR